MTDKMLAELKQKLLSSRDQFILSNRDMLPEAELPKASPALIKKSSSMMNSSMAGKDKANKDSRGDSDPVFTNQSEKRNLAVKQIRETFERSKMIRVGAQKTDANGRAIKGVTAVAVKDVLPMKQAELLKMAIVVNDDDLDKATMDAG